MTVNLTSVAIRLVSAMVAQVGRRECKAIEATLLMALPKMMMMGPTMAAGAPAAVVTAAAPMSCFRWSGCKDEQRCRGERDGLNCSHQLFWFARSLQSLA